MHTFPELVLGSVFVAPFMTYAAMALTILLALRPILRRCRFEKVFSRPAVAEVSLYVIVLGLLTVAV